MATRLEDRSRSFDIYLSDAPSRTLKYLNADSSHQSLCTEGGDGRGLLQGLE